MLKVNNIQPSFKGVWGNVQNQGSQPVIHYYRFWDEDSEQVKKEIDSKLNSPNNPWWTQFGQKIKVIVRTLEITKADLDKLNRGVMTDELARLLLRR